eukprot:scaffold1464_cov149-Skeletonema_menzelii.AAC.22
MAWHAYAYGMAYCTRPEKYLCMLIWALLPWSFIARCAWVAPAPPLPPAGSGDQTAMGVSFSAARSKIQTITKSHHRPIQRKVDLPSISLTSMVLK